MKFLFIGIALLFFNAFSENRVSFLKTSQVSVPLLLIDSTLCDGFDFPVGDNNGSEVYTAPDGKKYTGWGVTTKKTKSNNTEIFTGEDWNGKGGGNTDLGQPVYSIASGKVIFAGERIPSSGNIILVQHCYAENGLVITKYALYSFLHTIKVKKGDLINRRQIIGTIGKSENEEAHLHLEITDVSLLDNLSDYIPYVNNKTVEWVNAHYENCSDFIKAHRKISVPCKLDKLIVVHKSKFKCFVFSKGVLSQTYEIALGQQPIGPKEKQGDLKVPEGEYLICEKTKGPFSTATNWSAAYLGTRWLCITYPNTFDAQNALNKKTISQEQFNKISAATKAGVKPPQNTSLGGGIGLHGWIDEDWSNDSDRAQTWGCISFHNNDLNEFYDLVTLKTKVIIIP